MLKNNEKSDYLPILKNVKLFKKALIACAFIPAIFIDNLFSIRRSQIIEAKTFHPLSPDKPVLFYVHYSKNDAILENEQFIFEKIYSLGIQICLILNSDSYKTKSPSKIGQEFNNTISMLIVRRNKGYDLGAYRDAFNTYSKIDTTNSNKIFFMNNSLIWFPELMSSYFKDLLESKSDIVAGSISNQHIPHIQTFLFGAVTKTGINSLNQYFQTIKNWHFKRTIVRFGELRTNMFFERGLKVDALPSMTDLTSLGLLKIHDFQQRQASDWRTINRLITNRQFSFAGVPVNPSHNYWLEMIELGFPGIKKDLISKNPSNISDYEVAVGKFLETGHTYKDLASLLLANKSTSWIFLLRRFLKF